MNSQLTPLAWGTTVSLAIATDVAATRTSSPLEWALFGILLCPALVPFLWKPARPLRTYAAVLMLLTLLAVFFWTAVPAWMSRQSWFPDPSGYASAFITQSPKLLAAFVMIVILALLRFGPQDLFLTRGARGKSWIGWGILAALLMGFSVFVYLQASVREDPAGRRAVTYLPLALVLAAMNSFAEEILYRAALLAPLLRQVTANQAILMTAVLFGIAHYRGTPSGFPGMVLTFIAGWVFGFAMVETRSVLLPWFLHFVPDAVIFVTSALQN